MGSIVQAINEFKFEADVEEIFAFAVKRERIRERREAGEMPPWTEDEVLSGSKFLNVFREHDKVSKVINKYGEMLKGHDEMLYAYVYIARLVNHEKHINWLMKDAPLWLLDPKDLKTKMEEFIALGDTVCNPGAYQINPRIGFDMGYRTIRTSLVSKIPTKLQAVTEALASTNQIDEATDAANTAFGGFSNFWMFQAALDVAWLRPDLMDRNSEPYFGSGSKNAVVDHVEMLAYANANRPSGWREFYKFDIENMMCEYRKYRMRQAKGIPNNRKFKGSML